MTDESSESTEGRGDLSLSPMFVSGSGSFQMRFAVQNLMAAALFSRIVGEIERKYAGNVYGPFMDEILSYATACILCSVASLEAYANEFYHDRELYLPGFRKEVADKFWELFEEKPILEKFELALLLRNKPARDRGERPSQDIQVLVGLRNSLTHFKPEWETEQGDHARLSRRLRNKFTPSPFATGESNFFPRLWASHSCTSWAVRSCLEFTKDFESTAELPSKFNMFLDRLTP